MLFLLEVLGIEGLDRSIVKAEALVLPKLELVKEANRVSEVSIADEVTFADLFLYLKAGVESFFELFVDFLNGLGSKSTFDVKTVFRKDLFSQGKFVVSVDHRKCLFGGLDKGNWLVMSKRRPEFIPDELHRSCPYIIACLCYKAIV